MIKFLSVERIIQIHDAFLEDHGGLSGIRDMGLLISSIETPKASMFGQDLHISIYDKAAAYLFHIVKNHPFNDGNKRTGSVTAILFLQLNGVEITFCDEEYEEFVVEVAEGKWNKEEIANKLRIYSEEHEEDIRAAEEAYEDIKKNGTITYEQLIESLGDNV